MKNDYYSIPIFKASEDNELANFSIIDKNFYKDDILKFFSELKNKESNIIVINCSDIDKLEIKVESATDKLYFIKIKLKNNSVRIYFINKLEKPNMNTFLFYRIVERRELA